MSDFFQRGDLLKDEEEDNDAHLFLEFTFTICFRALHALKGAYENAYYFLEFNFTICFRVFTPQL